MIFKTKKQKAKEQALPKGCAQKIKRYLWKNKFFILILAAAMIFGALNVMNTEKSNGVKSPVQSAENTVQTAENTERHWRFYSIDLWILGAGSAVCFFMIRREKKKVKDKI
jgi:hypothetical protein